MNFTKLLLSVFAGACLLVAASGTIKAEVPKAQNTVVTQKLSRKARRRLRREKAAVKTYKYEQSSNRGLKGLFWGSGALLGACIAGVCGFVVYALSDVIGFVAATATQAVVGSMAQGAFLVAAGGAFIGLGVLGICSYYAYQNFRRDIVQQATAQVKIL